ncbi:TPA: hypothetical protein N0F65_002471 [Lagenidium giganteum]|uniref:Polycystin cation channel PKD1/PKD2 domain-containing protein n=1 Tax=Lagenidium giganteum TaxID=4803 RepID=A0AAV2YR34_9STRA|nr:TPA: hypothetical protein N0F65_002471 [Lagenidium giganteum]
MQARKAVEHSDVVERIDAKSDEVLSASMTTATTSATTTTPAKTRPPLHREDSFRRLAHLPVPYGSLSEALSFVIFLLLFVLATSVLEQDDQAFYLANRLQQALVGRAFARPVDNSAGFVPKTFYDIQDMDDVWGFLLGPLVDVVYPSSTTIPDDDATTASMVLSYNRLLGGVRLRTVRVVPNSCPKLAAIPEYASVVPFCYGPLTASTEQTAGYGPIRNSDIITASLAYQLANEFFAPISATKVYADLLTCYDDCSRSCGAHYSLDRPRYQDTCTAQCGIHCKCVFDEVSASDCPDPNPNAGSDGSLPTPVYAFNWSARSDTQSTSVRGALGSVPASGYVVDLPLNATAAREMLLSLKEDRYLDLATRALVIEFTVYNAYLRLFNIVQQVVEFPTAGGALVNSADIVLNLFRYSSNNTGRVVLEILLALFVAWRWKQFLVALYRMGIRTYLRYSFWNVVEAVHVVVFLAVIILRLYVVDQSYGTLSGNVATSITSASLDTIPTFQEFGNLADAERVLGSINAAIIWIKLLKYTQMSQRMCLLLRVLYRAAWDLFWFLAYFLAAMCGFGQVAYLLFGLDVASFRTLGDAIVTLLQAVAGDLDYNGMHAANNVLGPLFYVCFYFLLLMVLLNVFLAILNDAYLQTVAEEEERDEMWLSEQLAWEEHSENHDNLDVAAHLNQQQWRDAEQLRRYPFSKGIAHGLYQVWFDLRRSLYEWRTGQRLARTDNKSPATVTPDTTEWATKRSTTSRKLTRQVKKHLEQQMEQQMTTITHEQEDKAAEHAARVDEANADMAERLQGLIQHNQLKTKRLDDMEKMLGAIEKLCQQMVLEALDDSDEDDRYRRPNLSRNGARRQTVGAPAGPPRRPTTILSPRPGPGTLPNINGSKVRSQSKKRTSFSTAKRDEVEEISL